MNLFYSGVVAVCLCLCPVPKDYCKTHPQAKKCIVISEQPKTVPVTQPVETPPAPQVVMEDVVQHVDNTVVTQVSTEYIGGGK